MREDHLIVQQIAAAQEDSQAADDLIRQYLPFIKSETARFLKRIPIEGQDDELSIAMFAFYEAMMSYRPQRGAFLKLAATAIRNRLIDHYRKERRHQEHLSLDAPVSDDADGGSLLDRLDDGRDEIGALDERRAAADEIQDFVEQLAGFGLNLSDVADSCPRQERTLAACMQALDHARENPELLEQLVHSGKLPLAQLSEGAGIERKTLERHRKYLIAILLAYTNGFEIIRGHLYKLNRKEERPA